MAISSHGLSLAFALFCVTSLAAQAAPLDVDTLRRDLRHQDLLAALTSQLEASSDEDDKSRIAKSIALVSLEAQLFGRAVPLDRLATQTPQRFLPKLASIGKSAREELVLAQFAFLVGKVSLGEAALGRARDGDATLRKETNEVLASARKQSIPPGGYFRYRGHWLPLAQRDYDRALDSALEAVADVQLEGLLPFSPSREVANRKTYEALGNGVGEAKLRSTVTAIREALELDYATVRTWLKTYSKSPKLRESVQKKRAELQKIQTEAIKLIRRYDKPEQPRVDAYRDQVASMYADLREAVKRDFQSFDKTSTQTGWLLHERLRRRESALGQIDRYFAVAKLTRVAKGSVRPVAGSTVTTAHLLPGRHLSGLEDSLWLLVKHRAGQAIDVLDRSADLLRHRKKLTPWERLTLEIIRADAIDACNERFASSLAGAEREFVIVCNAYRRTLGLPPFEIEERLNVCAFKHSQEMVDLGYFGHISPVPRNRGPSDRAHLEGYNGGVGENCYAGSSSGRAAFSGWYHSPGHHRNLISGGPHLGVGRASQTMWTMVAGGTDWTWRSLHRDLPPAERMRLDKLVEDWLSAKPKAEARLRKRILNEVPAIMPALARSGFAAIRDPRHKHHPESVKAIQIIVDADLLTTWRSLQIAAIAASIESMRFSSMPSVRAAAWDLVKPHLQRKFIFQPKERDAVRAAVVTEIRKHWEDEAQWRFHADPTAKPPEVDNPLHRKADGLSKKAARRMLSRKDRLRMAKRFGGSTKTELAVEHGLAFLAKIQDEDGAWRARSFGVHLPKHRGNPGRGTAEWEIAMTGLSILAFTSAGYTSESGAYAEVLSKGADFLMSKVIDYGKFETVSSHYMYNHAIGTQALCELYSYTADPRLGASAQLVVDYLVYAQHQESGGWRYLANERGDTSVSGWVIMALNSAYKAELDVSGFRGALRFLDSVTQRPYYQVGYLGPNDNGTHKNRLTAVAMTGRLFLGANSKDSRLVLPAYRLVEDLPAAGRVDFYYWYYATLALFQIGDPFWKTWNKHLKETLLALQVDNNSSELYGSWAPRGEWAKQGGRIYQTALGVLMLTTYYRYDRAPKNRLHPFTGNIQNQAAPLLEAIREDGDPHQLRIAMRKIADEFGPSLVGPIATALGDKKQPLKYRKRLASILVEVAAPQNEAVLVGLIDDPDSFISEQIMRAVVRVSSRESRTVLETHLANRHAGVRKFCAINLGRLGNTSSITNLTDRLAKEPNGTVKKAIEKALHLLQRRSALNDLLSKALPPKTTGYLLILDGLEHLERAGLTEVILGLETTAPKTFKKCILVIKKFRAAAAIPLLLLLLEHRDLAIRTKAIKTLRMLTHKQFGYDAKAGEQRRRGAIKDWDRWWKNASKGFQSK